MEVDRATEIASHLMTAFARRTGLAPPSASPQRYLWTDAFAVCNFLELTRRYNGAEALTQARALIDHVHHVLGRFRNDDPRRGWLGGRSKAEGEGHPTAAGLRIGKPLPERGAREAIDERLEWDRDGQYFHYLTKWMHALCQAACFTGETRYAQWAAELGKAAYDGFARRSASGTVIGVSWKMSTDLSRALVPGMGLHDALDGAISLREAEHALAGLRAPAAGLEASAASLGALCVGHDWTTDDTLGLGGLLFDAGRLCQLGNAADEADLLEDLLTSCAHDLSGLLAGGQLSRPLAHRLAFRELGLAIGLRALPLMADAVSRALPSRPSLGRALDLLRRTQPLADEIVADWLPQAGQSDASWRAHRDINEVMLASALIPDTVLAVGKPAS
jgi:hypothetical protein